MPAERPITLDKIGEDKLVAMLIRSLPQGADVRVAAGDDCAVVGRPDAASWTLLKTDAVLENVHFLPGEDARRVGWKALCRAISDIAAMGGLPQHALVTLAVARNVELAWVRRLYFGLRRAAARFNVSIVGGETARSPGPIFINIALTGLVERERCVLRSGGKAGDALFVTGKLGGSIGGKHLNFIPRLEEARWLTEHFQLHAMMDLSDGVGADLPRLAAASHCGFQIEPERIPRSRGSSIEQALADGEDYELLFALAPGAAEQLEHAWKNRFPKLPLTRIGSLTSRPSTSRQFPHGFDHFAKSR
ncbi:MAG: Thiamine-monophosphate kinase [Chthoniobacteraceae bacterium]|nr:Thiamine-monophosphate kinase [Chthoniobacteraceae bacterium]